MWRSWLAGLSLLAVSLPAGAEFPAPPAPSQGLLCRTAIAAAEKGSGIPPNLLAAISRVESGRRDPVTGDYHPWPWTVDADGEGTFYDTKAQAVAAVRALQASGVQSIDVGCAQVNLMHHPDAFPNLETAFDPQANEAYAARFLKELFAQTGDWTKAVALYHSATPEIGADYQRKVLAVLPEEQRLEGAGPSPLAQAWGATLSAPPPAFTRVLRLPGPGISGSPVTIIQQPMVGGAAAPGRDLASYRARPIVLAVQPPVRRTLY